MTEFEAVYREYFRDVELYLLAICHDAALSEELTAQVFFKTMDALPSLIVFKCDPRFYGVGWGIDVPQMMIIFLIMTVLYYGCAMLIIKNRIDKEKL